MAKRRKVQPGWWERGYLSHHFWNKKGKVGSVLLCHGPNGERVYKWTCIATNANGHSADLTQAKCALEQAYAMGWVQVDLDGIQTIESALHSFASELTAAERAKADPFIVVPSKASQRSADNDEPAACELPVWAQPDLFAGFQAHA